jgi:uncharacterized protein (TIGR02145 family)
MKDSVKLLIKDPKLPVLRRRGVFEASGNGAYYNGYVVNRGRSKVYDDWYLGSIDDVFAMNNVMANETHDIYWSSSEVWSNYAFAQSFHTGASTAKGEAHFVRAIRNFDSSEDYSNGDFGQAGIVFNKVDLGGGVFRYYEAHSEVVERQWSNITNADVGVTSQDIGTGVANTQLIINQTGFTDGAAKYCDDLEVTIESEDAPFAPVGYHVMTAEEAGTIATALGGTTIAGGKMKEAGLAHWLTPNTDADNTSGFTLLPAGVRDVDGVFAMRTELGAWWVIAEFLTVAYASYDNAELTINEEELDSKFGLPVRWVKDDGLIGIGRVTDIDGNDYELVDIGGIVVTKTTITTEHFTDGSPIPKVPDNEAWAALTSPGMCYYNEGIVYTASVDPDTLTWEEYEINEKYFQVITNLQKWYFGTDSSYTGFTMKVYDTDGVTEITDGEYHDGYYVGLTPINENVGGAVRNFSINIADWKNQTLATATGTQPAGTKTATADPNELNWDYDETDSKSVQITTNYGRWYLQGSSSYSDFTLQVYDEDDFYLVTNGIYLSGYHIRLTPKGQNNTQSIKNAWVYITDSPSGSVLGGFTGVQAYHFENDPPVVTIESDETMSLTGLDSVLEFASSDLWIQFTPDNISPDPPQTIYVTVTKLGPVVIGSDTITNCYNNAMRSRWITLSEPATSGENILVTLSTSNA